MASGLIGRAFDEMALEYERTVDGELRRFWGLSYAEFVEWFVGSAPPRPGDVVLDLATGVAAIPRRMARDAMRPSAIVGLDLTHAVLTHASDALRRAGQDVTSLVCASAMAIPLATDSVDLALCALGTHHMDSRPLVAEIARVLRPGGRLALSDVAAAPMWGWPGVSWILRAIAWAIFLPSSGPARAWAESDAVTRIHTPNQWRAILQDAGFVEVAVTLPFGRRQPLGLPVGAPAPFFASATLPPST